jgi:hypothetical protein
MIKKAQDVLNDNSHAVLYKIAQSMEFKLPKYVEQGVPLEKDAAASVSDSLFADDIHRRYPLTDKANTWLSGAYFAKTASDAYSNEEYQRIAKRIIKAAELYGISEDVCGVMGKIINDELEAKNRQIEKDAEAAMSCYGEPETGGFPMFDIEQVKMANAYFDENAYAYDWKRRANIAKNIMRKSAEYGVVPSETVRKEAGEGFPRVDFLAENLLSREAEFERRGLHKLAGDMRRTIKIICKADPEDLMANLEPLREMISGSDELSGIDSEYGHKFLPPADFLFDIGDDDAKEFHEDTIPMGGELMSAKALSGLPRKIFESVMSPSMVDSLFDGGHLSPKKISITIVKMSPRDKTSLLDSIRDFTSGEGQEYNDDENTESKSKEDEDSDKED